MVTPFRVARAAILIWVSATIFASTKLWIESLPHAVISSMNTAILVVNFAVYLKIYLILQRHQRQIQHQQLNNENNCSVKRVIKSAMNTFVAYISLLCCYAPYSLSAQMEFAGVLIISPYLYITSFTLLFLNSSLNPLLYCWRDRAIRTAVKQLFCC